jgi:hypothetical protein
MSVAELEDRANAGWRTAEWDIHPDVARTLQAQAALTGEGRGEIAKGADSVTMPPPRGQREEAWMGASEAWRWAAEGGINVSLQTIARAKDKNLFRWREGGADCTYEVEQDSFDAWVRGWQRNRSAPKTGRKS